MNTADFRKYGKQMVDYIADYYDTVRDRDACYSVQPGFMKGLIPSRAPEDGESWEDIVRDVERVIMPGISHWRSPNFHGYFAAGDCFPSLMGDMLCDALGCIGFSWDSAPACTELEIATTDWLGDMLGLPASFLHSGKGSGGGVIQTTASETVLFVMLAARNKKVKEVLSKHPHMTRPEVLSKLTSYCSLNANASVPKAGLMAGINMTKIHVDGDEGMNPDTLTKRIQDDIEQGLIPFFLCATFGTTGTCAMDDLSTIGPICTNQGMWLHVDAAYAGSAFVCPEFRSYMEGIEHAESISINPHKWMLIHFDLSVMWIQHSEYLVETFNVDPVYLRHDNQNRIPDFRHWQIPLGRRFRSLKLWFTLRYYGVKGVQKYIRHHVSMAHYFKELVTADSRFEVPFKVRFGLCCFRLKGENYLSKRLLQEIKKDKRLFFITDSVKVKGKDVVFLRFAVVTETITKQDIQKSFKILCECADKVLQGALNENGHTNGACNKSILSSHNGINGHSKDRQLIEEILD